MKTAILTRLRGDSQLTTLLPGGIFDASEVGEISRQATQTAFDANGELQPCALLVMGTEVATGPLESSARLSFTIYFYQLVGTSAIEPARQRVYALLHRQRLQPATGGAWDIRNTDDILSQRDDALDSALLVSRYAVALRKEFDHAH